MTATAPQSPDVPEGAEEPAPSSAPDDVGSRPEGASGASSLEEEGEVAADYLEELLDIVDLDGDIEIDVEDDRAAVSVLADGEGGTVAASSSLSVLVGRRGEVLEALQELTRLAVQARTGDRSRLVLDVAGYRGERRRELEAAARQAVEAVRSSGTSVSLGAMNPFERKMVHDEVARSGLVSDSEGVEPQRRVVVRPA